MARKFHIIFLITTTLLFIIFYQQSFNKPSPNKYNPGFDPLIERSNSTGNIPEIYFSPNFKTPKYGDNCTIYPDLFDLRIRNDYWQIQETTNGTLYLFNAYIDERNGSVVRILAMYDRYLPKQTFFCQFWYLNSSVVAETKTPFWLFRQKWGADSDKYIHPYLITCPLPRNKEIPASVSLIENPCDSATNNLKISYKKVKEKKNFVVCVKGLSFPYEENSARLTEWIELVNILGAEKINFYEFSVHPVTEKVLNYYVNKGKIEVTPLKLVGDVSNQPLPQNQYLHKKNIDRRLQEVIPYNDCLYKHLQEFRYVVLLDTDEVIVPVQNTWVELIQTLRDTQPKRSSYVARNVYFLDNHLHQHDWFDDIPQYMHMLQHVHRAKNYTKPGYFVKGFHDIDMVLGVHNHYPIACLKVCSNIEIDVNLAHLQHYRADCVAGVSDCDMMKVESVMDARVWNFKEELIERVKRTFEDLKLFYR